MGAPKVRNQQAVLDQHGNVVVAGHWDPMRLAVFFRDDDLAGKRVLEMGSNTGGLSLELARRGARVHSAEPLKPNETARRLASSERLAVEWSTTELFASHDLGRFDTIVCFGLIYHFRHPQYVLDYLSSLGAPVLYLSSQTMPGDELLMRNRNENREIYRREGNVRGYEPTHKLLRSMLRAAGFDAIELLTDKEHNRPGHPKGLTNSAYYRAELIKRVDPDALAKQFEPSLA